MMTKGATGLDTRCAHAAREYLPTHRTMLKLAGTSAKTFRAILAALALGFPGNAALACATPALAFRFDDVQDYWLSDAQKAVIGLFSERNVPLTLGIIGGFFGQDGDLITAIRSHVGRVEIANHGLHAKNAPGGESILLSQDGSITRKQIEKSSETITKLLGVVPKVFIPHKNQYDDEVLHALELLDFDYISSACSRHIETPLTCEDACGYLNERSCTEPDPYGLVHVPVGASTQWEPTPGKGSARPEDVLEEIRRSTDHYGFAVVMLHPQDFIRPDKSVDPRALDGLGELLSKVRKADTHKIVTLSQVSLPCEP